VHKLKALTGLRFMAAAMIVAGHLQGHFVMRKMLWYQFGHGVTLFFVLSGFILTYNYPELPTTKSRLRFLLARFARIWPAYIASIVIAIIAIGQPIPVWEWFTNLTLIHSWIPLQQYLYAINGPSWSISTEFFFYLSFPILIAGLSSNWWIKLAGSFAVAAGLIALCYAFAIEPYSPGASGVTLVVLYFNPLARIFEFVLGMCVALAWRRFGGMLTSTSLGTALEITALFAFFSTTWWASYMIGHSFLGNIGPALQWFAQCSSAAIPAALLIFVLASGRGAISWLFATAPLVFLGETSYSIYLLHATFLASYDISFSRALGGLPDWLLLGGYVSAVVLASSCVLLLIERPCRHWITGIGSKLILRFSRNSIDKAVQPSLAELMKNKSETARV
jgi:peptidoglycan/LPS O-acetylase OafA/YrhL